MKASRLAIILAVALGFGGICYLGVRHYGNTLLRRSYYVELQNPCRPKGLSAAATNALPSDATIQEGMAGSWWHCSLPSYLDNELIWRVSRVAVASNGDYACHVSYRNSGIRSNVIQGDWRVKDGLLFDTITNYKFGLTNQAALYVFSNQVVRVTDRELVYRSCPDGDVTMFRRVKQANK